MGRRQEHHCWSGVIMREGAPSRLFSEKGVRGLLQKRLLVLKAQATQLAAGANAPAAGRGHRVKALFLSRSHGSGTLELLCAGRESLARNSRR